MTHTLTVTEDPTEAARVRADGGDDAEVRDTWSWHVGCPFDPGDRSRPCRTWRECCAPAELGRGHMDLLDRDGQRPCAVSPTGLHEKVNNDLFAVGYPTNECYLRIGEDITDQIHEELLPTLTPGEHHVDIGWDGYGDPRIVTGPDEEGNNSE